MTIDDDEFWINHEVDLSISKIHDVKVLAGELAVIAQQHAHETDTEAKLELVKRYQTLFDELASTPHMDASLVAFAASALPSELLEGLGAKTGLSAVDLVDNAYRTARDTRPHLD